jgi:mycothiol synthase
VAVTAEDDRGPIAYAQASTANETLALEVVVAPEHRPRLEALGSGLIAALFEAIEERDGGAVNWWIHGNDELATLAALAGFVETRRMFQMRMPLPASRSAEIETRAFVVGQDEDDWVRVNNRAFAGHGEQGGWTTDTLRLREGEPWFDPTGFRIHERDGRLAGFCWTKVHETTAYEPLRVGEIYVIAVDPDFHGLGLGSQLTLAGLDHLTGIGITAAMLYVDAANTTAVSMYERLGYRTHTVSTAHHIDIAAARSPEETR